MIFFWDKNCPKTIPETFRKLGSPNGIEIYIEHYPLSNSAQEGGDERWLEAVGQNGWIVITQDYSFHKEEKAAEMQAIKDYGIGCFYLWGARATKWQIVRCFFRAYDRIMLAAETTEKPFIYWISETGRLTKHPL